MCSLTADRRWTSISVPADAPLWTDDFSNVVAVLNWSYKLDCVRRGGKSGAAGRPGERKARGIRTPLMPILPREPDIFPETLFETGVSADPGFGWWAGYTLPRREKELMRRLHRLEIAFYCPMIQRRSRSPAGRVRTSFNPLFPGYVFILGPEEVRYRA